MKFDEGATSRDTAESTLNGPAAATVILVHGLWLHGIAFALQRRWLQRRGYRVLCFSYPSVRRGLDANSEELNRYVRQAPGTRIHLVGHSLGGLIVLAMLAQSFDPRIRRIVLMGSPCAGSHCAATLLQTSLAGVVGRSLRDAVQRTRWALPPGIEVGVLAGERGLGLGRIVPGLRQPNDGTVAVVETRLAGSQDAVTLPVSHTEMLFSSACARQVAAFLDAGQFLHA